MKNCFVLDGRNLMRVMMHLKKEEWVWFAIDKTRVV